MIEVNGYVDEDGEEPVFTASNVELEHAGVVMAAAISSHGFLHYWTKRDIPPDPAEQGEGPTEE